MSQVSRTNDIGVGTCTAHQTPIPMTGVIVSSTSKVFCDKLQTAVEGDIVVGNCGHTGVLTASTAVLFVEGKRAIRNGDSFSGAFSGVIVNGSPVTDSK